MSKKIKGFKFFNGENDKQMNMNQPVKEETLDEKSDQARRNKTMKNMMDASRGARYKLNNPVPDTDHKTPQAKNKAIGRALRNEELDESTFDNKDHAQSIADKLKKKNDDGNYSVVADHGKHRIVHAYNSDSKVKKDIARLTEMKTGNPGFGYHGQHQTTHNGDEAYKKIHAHVKSLTDSDDKTVKHYLDSAHGRHLVGHENDHDHIKKDFKKFSKYYKPEMHEATAQKGVNVDDVNAAGQEPHEEKWEAAKKTVTKLKKVKEGNMKSYKEFVAQINEYNSDESGVYRHTKKATYGTSYVDPEGADETAADMKKKEKKAAGRKTGQRTGSYKPRATMSKLKSAGSTYK
jgi:hypothetical protein